MISGILAKMDATAADPGTPDASVPPIRRGFAEIGGEHLSVVLAPAAAAAARPSAPPTWVVFCPPLLEERLNAHPYLVWFAGRLARQGIGTVRFDYPGCGESLPVGPTRDVAEYGRAIDGVAAWIRAAQPGARVGLLGLTSASLAMAHTDAGADLAIFWEPVADATLYARNLLRANILQQQTVHGEIVRDSAALRAALDAGETFTVEGHAITAEFHDALLRTPPLAETLARLPGPVFALTRRSQATLGRALAGVPDLDARLQLSPVDGPFWNTGYARYLPLPLPCMNATEAWLLADGRAP
jgi:hypothetical protein